MRYQYGVPVVPVAEIERLANLSETRVCVFCDHLVDEFFCFYCDDYKGVMTVPEWESYTGEIWETEE